MEQPFERGESGNGSYLDHEVATSISGGSSPTLQYKFYRGDYMSDGLITRQELSQDLNEELNKRRILFSIKH